MELSYSIAGFITGLVIGVTGVGGGSLMTPILILLFHVKPVIAVGTDLLYAAITKSGGVAVHHRRKTIHWNVVGLLATGSVPASLGTLLLLKQLNMAQFNYEGLIISSLSFALILTALFLLGKNKLYHISKQEKFTAIKLIHKRYCKQITIAAGALLGMLVTVSSVGAGVIGAALLFFLYPRFRTIDIIGTDLAHAIPITAIAGLGHVHLGTVDFSLLLSLLIGSLPGIFIGSHIGSRLPEDIIRPVLAFMLLIIGLRLLIA